MWVCAGYKLKWQCFVYANVIILFVYAGDRLTNILMRSIVSQILLFNIQKTVNTSMRQLGHFCRCVTEIVSSATRKWHFDRFCLVIHFPYDLVVSVKWFPQVPSVSTVSWCHQFLVHPDVISFWCILMSSGVCWCEIGQYGINIQFNTINKQCKPDALLYCLYKLFCHNSPPRSLN